MGDGEEGHMLDVGVMFGGVGHDVMDIVASFPPTLGHTTEEIGDEDAYTRVDVEIVGYAHVSSIMGGECELMPERSHEER